MTGLPVASMTETASARRLLLAWSGQLATGATVPNPVAATRRAVCRAAVGRGGIDRGGGWANLCGSDQRRGPAGGRGSGGSGRSKNPAWRDKRRIWFGSVPRRWPMDVLAKQQLDHLVLS